MPRFAYYEGLDRAQRRTYRRSDAVARVEVPREAAAALREAAVLLVTALPSDRVRTVNAPARALVEALCAALGVPAPRVMVRAKRPVRAESELHGLYTRWEDGRCRIELWMRTAAHARVVSPRTFCRTLLHEVCHHLDYELLGLPDSFHTEGFFRRESSLVRELLGAPARAAPRSRAERAPRAEQLTLRLDAPPPTMPDTATRG